MDDIDADVELLNLELAASRIDLIVDSHGCGSSNVDETLRLIEGTVSLFIHFSAAPPDEASLLVDYAREVVAALANQPEVRDPVLIEYFDAWIEGENLAKTWMYELEVMLQRIEASAMSGDPFALDELRGLCGGGVFSHRSIFRLHRAVEITLRSAHRLGFADALRDAISPDLHHSGQIASRDRWPDMFALAFNLLAHLAADPERGDVARSALLDLADFIETAGEAVIRLPFHLLDDSQRQRLLEIHDRRVSTFTEEPSRAVLGLELLRDSRVVRTALWQAFDARHIV